MPDQTGPADAARTTDAGWEVGVRTTVDAVVDRVWAFLLGDGLPLWLGNTTLTLEKGEPYATDDGISGRILGFTEGSRIRMTWQPDEWNHDSTLRLTVREAANGTTIEFHQERLSGRDERRIMLGHWKDVVAELEAAL
jgi:uncharacterized protein YndB with AHSA1/START domain